MPLHEYHCKCGARFEKTVPWNRYRVKCACGKMAKRIYTVVGLLNETPGWMQKTLEVIDKDDPRARRLMSEGSRSELKKYMKEKGIRFMEDGEKVITRQDRLREARKEHDRIVREVYDKHREKSRIEINR
uniref:Putative regulatory protein FmdB zinc ribbon domain-containing protein n=1 Tax=viral metagenome TaxID=1070528 RepID=A0A6H1ZUY0_9ZZZZ